MARFARRCVSISLSIAMHWYKMPHCLVWQNMIMLYMEPMAATAWYHAQRLCVPNTNTAHVATPIVPIDQYATETPSP